MFKRSKSRKNGSKHAGTSNIPMDEYFRKPDATGSGGIRVSDEELKVKSSSKGSAFRLFGGSKTKKKTPSTKEPSALDDTATSSKTSKKSGKSGLSLGRKKHAREKSRETEGDTSFAPGLLSGPEMSTVEYSDVYSNVNSKGEFDFGNPFVVGNESSAHQDSDANARARVPKTALEAEGVRSATTGVAREKNRIPKVIMELGHANLAKKPDISMLAKQAPTLPPRVPSEPKEHIASRVPRKEVNVPPPPSSAPPAKIAVDPYSNETIETKSSPVSEEPRTAKSVTIQIPKGIVEAERNSYRTTANAKVEPPTRHEAVHNVKTTSIQTEGTESMSIEERLRLRAKANVFKR